MMSTVPAKQFLVAEHTGDRVPLCDHIWCEHQGGWYGDLREGRDAFLLSDVTADERWSTQVHVIAQTVIAVVKHLCPAGKKDGVKAFVTESSRRGFAQEGFQHVATVTSGTGNIVHIMEYSW